MSDRGAPKVVIAYARESEQHDTVVRLFATFLRVHLGLAVELDQWEEGRRRDKVLWATKHFSEADFILVIASPAYRRQAEGTAPPDEGRQAQFESAFITNLLVKNLRSGTAQILPVVLPGHTVDDIPAFLAPHSTTIFKVESFTQEGVSRLVGAITGHARYPMPERGVWRDGLATTPTRSQLLLTDRSQWVASGWDVRPSDAWIDGVHYDDSIVLRPSSVTPQARGFVEVDLAGAYRRLTSVVGVLDDAAEAFQVGRFAVYLDGREHPEHQASYRKPRMVEVDVTGAMRLRLEMYRPSVSSSPLRAGTRTAQVSRLPELAWGNPTLL
ncbi:SEFIR domain-containing protein [Actinokineospora sp. NBRC 105648]|uniref:SEFIR domain-containing protein n=1 Tax=Actinokineospora sp. NBRC 105648 TaxID=3032206 RepID=UPI0024A57955|nr:SEFIR domain-containing protein [Actinokineospora sp. NBRC 105648]GLZ41937.1 hypothetical protein Acsp05_55610 [Actinokineospora sp. NBRC 105648]